MRKPRLTDDKNKQLGLDGDGFCLFTYKQTLLSTHSIFYKLSRVAGVLLNLDI